MSSVRQLTQPEIDTLATRKGVKTQAVKNFLGSMGTSNPSGIRYNALSDAKSYKWNAATRDAILKGIEVANGKATIKINVLVPVPDPVREGRIQKEMYG